MNPTDKLRDIIDRFQDRTQEEVDKQVGDVLDLFKSLVPEYDEFLMWNAGHTQLLANIEGMRRK